MCFITFYYLHFQIVMFWPVPQPRNSSTVKKIRPHRWNLNWVILQTVQIFVVLMRFVEIWVRIKYRNQHNFRLVFSFIIAFKTTSYPLLLYLFFMFAPNLFFSNDQQVIILCYHHRFSSWSIYSSHCEVIFFSSLSFIFISFIWSICLYSVTSLVQ